VLTIQSKKQQGEGIIKRLVEGFQQVNRKVSFLKEKEERMENYVVI